MFQCGKPEGLAFFVGMIPVNLQRQGLGPYFLINLNAFYGDVPPQGWVNG